MEHEVFAVYKLVIEDTNQLSNRRQMLDNLYVTIVTLVLGADAYIAANSRLADWFPVLVTIGISLVGVIFTNHWRRVLQDLKEVLKFRYEWLKEMEAQPDLVQIGACVYTSEDIRIYKPRESAKSANTFGFAARATHLQMIFVVIFISIPFILAGATLLASLPQLHQFIRPLIGLQ